MDAGGSTDAVRLLERIDTLESRLHQVGAELEHTERLATLGTIAGLIAHEFNNILTPVMSYAQMAMGAPGDAELTAKALQRAVEGSQRASEIASAILSFTREFSAADSADGDGSPALANVERVVGEAMTCMARRPEADGIRLRLSLAPGATGRIRPIALQHVLLNVILNAKAALGSTGGELTIESRLESEPPAVPESAACSRCSTWNIPAAVDGWLCVRVQDTGHGMSAAKLAQIFTPFYTTRADQPAGEQRGTGLGMTLCQRLLESVGGFMIVESREGHGTWVTIALPAGEREGGTRAADERGERAA